MVGRPHQSRILSTPLLLLPPHSSGGGGNRADQRHPPTFRTVNSSWPPISLPAHLLPCGVDGAHFRAQGRELTPHTTIPARHPSPRLSDSPIGVVCGSTWQAAAPNYLHSGPLWAAIVCEGKRSGSLSADLMLVYERCVLNGFPAGVSINHTAGRQEIMIFCSVSASAAATSKKRCHHRHRQPSCHRHVRHPLRNTAYHT